MLMGLLMVSVTACGDDEAEAPEEEPGEAEGLEGSISMAIDGESEAEVEYWEGIRDEVLEEHPDAEIELIEMDLMDHLEVIDDTDPTNEDVADVIPFPDDRVHGLDANNALAPVDAEAMADSVDGYDQTDFEEGISDMMEIDGEHLGFPFDIETMILFANKENAEEADLDLEADAPFEFTEDFEYEDMLANLTDAWFAIPFLNSADMEYLTQEDDGTVDSVLAQDFEDLTEEQQGVFEALYSYWEEHHEAGTPLWDQDAAPGYIDDNFATGEGTSIVLEGPWSTPDMLDIAGDPDNLEILPTTDVEVNGEPLVHFQSGWGLGINARLETEEEEMQLAKEFILHAADPDNAVEYFESTGDILETAEPETYQDAGLTTAEEDTIEAVYDSFEEAPTYQPSPEWDQVWDTWTNALLAWESEEPDSVEEAYEEVQASFEAMLAGF